MSQISKAYPHGSRFRCRTKTDAGWRWCPSADSPEEATAAATAATAAASRGPSDHAESLPEAAEDPSAGSRLFRLEQEKPLKEGTETTTAEPRTRCAEGPDGARITGPYPHEGGYRCRITTSAGRTWAASASTEAQALRMAEAAAAKAAKAGAVTVGDALSAYLRYKERIGLRPESVTSIRNAVRALFRGMLGAPVARTSPRVCQAQYDRLQETVDPRTGRTISVATHRMYLSLSRSFYRWVAERGWVGDNPLDKVRGEGRRKRGKKQLHLHEAHALSQACRREAERGDAGATATLMLLHMALRASEALSRTVRDLDGNLLRICDNEEVGFQVKTDKSARPVKVPAFLQPILAERARGRAATDPLFPGPKAGRQTRQWLYMEVRRLCALAGAPQVCPHSLRGAFATALASTGESVEVVAQLLGHESTAMTLGHYIAPGVSEAAALERAALAFTSQSLPS